MKIIFDLDGTLINCEDRLYNLFRDLVKQSNLSKEEYWSLKRNKKNHEYILAHILGKDTSYIENFNKKWLSNIETKKYIEFDKLYNYTIDGLIELKKENELYLVTARQSKEILMYELERLKIKDYFKEIYLTEHKTDKYTLIKENIDTESNTILVGDTGHDINTGKQLGIKTMAVYNGFLCKEVLLDYNPDYIYSDFYRGFKEIIR